MNKELFSFKFLRQDLLASLTVFFVAISLCLGLAYASDAPPIAGLIAGIIGGLVVAPLSNSGISVSGPAAALCTYTLYGIQELNGNFSAFLIAIIISGFFQILFAFLNLAFLANFISNSVINAMIAAIGLILILKQLPHLLGYDIEVMGAQEFSLDEEDIRLGYENNPDLFEDNTFTVFGDAFHHFNPKVLFIGMICLLILFLWDKFVSKRCGYIPGSLLAVLIGILLNYSFVYFGIPGLDKLHRVNLPEISSLLYLKSLLINPDWSALQKPKLYLIGIGLALISSLGSLLTVKAMDKIDPYLRRTSLSKELWAQGIGNICSGLLGGLPVMAVVVRSSVNLTAGARTKLSAILHSIWLLLALLFLSKYIAMIPLASLAAILVYTGFKLNKPSLYISHYRSGYEQFIPFLVTIVSILLTDLLTGIFIGIACSVIFILKKTYDSTVIHYEEKDSFKKIVFGENLNFIQKPKVIKLLNSIQPNSTVEIDLKKTIFIDHDIEELILEFQYSALKKNITVILDDLNLIKIERKLNKRQEHWGSCFHNPDL